MSLTPKQALELQSLASALARGKAMRKNHPQGEAQMKGRDRPEFHDVLGQNRCVRV